MAAPQGIDLSGDGGVMKVVLEEGSGELVPASAHVSVHYTGTLEDGTVFDSSVEREAPFKFRLGIGEVIKGWDLGVASMKVGEKAELFCAPNYAYGENGSPPAIPEKATLKFVVEVLSFQKDPDSVSERILAATKEKEHGNALFKEAKFAAAIDSYKAAIDRFRYFYPQEQDKAGVNQIKLICYLNEAACHLRLKNYSAARIACEHVLDIDSNSVKALYRRAQSWAGAGDYEQAKADLMTAIRLEPNNVDLRKELESVKTEEQAYLQRQKDLFSKMGASFGDS